MGLAGTGATGWGYVGETSSQRLRAHTAGFAAAMSAGFGVITNVAVPYLINEDAANLGLKTAWVSSLPVRFDGELLLNEPFRSLQALVRRSSSLVGSSCPRLQSELRAA